MTQRILLIFLVLIKYKHFNIKLHTRIIVYLQYYTKMFSVTIFINLIKYLI